MIDDNHIQLPVGHSGLESVIQALLYEGYSLFPYHRSAIKNQKPVPFGVIYPRIFCVYNPPLASDLHVESLVYGPESPEIVVSLRFLHLVDTKSDGWQAIERKTDISVPAFSPRQRKKQVLQFLFGEEHDARGSLMSIRGFINIQVENMMCAENVHRLTIGISNTTPMREARIATRDKALRHSMLSTHIVATSSNGRFVSSQNPPGRFKRLVETCSNSGAWPVLGDESDSIMLFSPIIVYDYPKINTHSKADLFDSTEIEEALMLHFLSMSDEEKERIAAADERLASMLEKVRSQAPEVLKDLHGMMRENE